MFKQPIKDLRELPSYLRDHLANSVFKKLRNWRYSPMVVIIVLGIALPYLVGTMQMTYSLPSRGTIKAINVKVYNDSSCTIPLSSIDWGMLEPGSSENRTIYVKNEGNSALTLSLNTTDWSAGAAAYIALDWDCEGQVIGPDQSIGAILTLEVSENITQVSSFTFNIIILGTG